MRFAHTGSVGPTSRSRCGQPCALTVPQLVRYSISSGSPHLFASALQALGPAFCSQDHVPHLSQSLVRSRSNQRERITRRCGATRGASGTGPLAACFTDCASRSSNILKMLSLNRSTPYTAAAARAYMRACRDLQIAAVNSSGQIHSSLHSMYLFP